MKQHAGLIVLFAVFFVSLSAILIRLSNAPAIAIAAHRMLYTAALTLPLAMRSGLQVPDKRSGLLLLLGGLVLALHFATWIRSLSLTSVASATILVSVHPIVVTIGGALLLGEIITRRVVVLMIVALAGTAIIAAGGGFESAALTGNLLALAGGITAGIYFLIGRFLRRTLSTPVYTLGIYTIAGVVLLAWALVAGIPLLTYSGREYLIFIGLAVFPTLLGHSLFSWSLRYLNPAFVSISILGEPIFSSIMAAILFAELPGPSTIVGGSLVVVALYLLLRRKPETSGSSTTPSSPSQ
jgi:drug/metabolite transporter (DMT)-like permease